MLVDEKMTCCSEKTLYPTFFCWNHLKSRCLLAAISIFVVEIHISRGEIPIFPWFPHGFPMVSMAPRHPRRLQSLRGAEATCDLQLSTAIGGCLWTHRVVLAAGATGCITQGGLTYQLIKIEDLTCIFHFQNRDPARIGIWLTIVVPLTSFTRRSGFDEEKMRQCSGVAKPSMVSFHFGDDSVARQCSAVRLPEVCHTGCPAASGSWLFPCEDVLELYSRLIYVEISWLYIHIRHVDLIFFSKIQEPAYSCSLKPTEDTAAPCYQLTLQAINDLKALEVQYGRLKDPQEIYHTKLWLIGGLEHFLFFHILWVTIPTD